MSNLKPDIVILDKSAKKVNIFELTCPSEGRIDISNKLKYEKYQHFLTDIVNYKPSVTPFEVGAQSGYISRRNKETLKTLHKFCKSSIKLKQFTNNISAICILSSYFLFNCRNQQQWEAMDPILPPFKNQ